jgi:predicted permease
MVSEDYFRVLGVTPWRGRFFNPDESHAAADVPVVVASYMLWQRLGARSDFVGSQLEIDGRTFTVIGVTPRGFGGLQWCIGPDVWLPLGMASFVSEMRTTARLNVLDPTWRPWNIIAKLAPETSLAAANAGVAPLNETLTAQAGLRAGERLELLIDRPAPANANLTIPEHATVVSTYAAMSGGITIVVLLVACLNVANMLLARGAARQREIAIRLSLGASRGRVVRQLVTEGLLLGLGGAAMGLLLSRVANEALLELTRRATENQPFSFYLQTTVDWPLLVTTLGLGVLATLACSVLPAFRVTRVDLAHDLKQVPADIHGSARFFSGRHMLVMLQIALSVMLLFSAGLLLRGTMNITGDRGFDVAHQLLVKADYSLHRTPREEIPRRQAALADQIAALPGIEHVALASSVPYNFESSWGKIFGVGSAGAGAEPAAEGIFNAVSAGYFDTLGIPLLRGRDFTVEESRQPGKHRVAIIDEVLAKALFGGAEPLGRRIAFASAANRGANSDRELEVIGIVRSPQDDPFAALHPPRVYQPLGQEPHAMIYVHARVARPEAMLATLRKTLGVFDAERPVLFCGPFAEIVDNNLNFWVLRIGPVLFGVFGGAAVFLAAVGVYGVKAYAVTRRTREIGVRVALGATARDVLRLILGQSVRQAAVGIAAGGTLAIVTGLGLSKLLYRVSPTDPLMLGVAATVAALAAIAAAALPAWRATRIQPTEALRTE